MMSLILRAKATTKPDVLLPVNMPKIVSAINYPIYRFCVFTTTTTTITRKLKYYASILGPKSCVWLDYKFRAHSRRLGIIKIFLVP